MLLAKYHFWILIFLFYSKGVFYSGEIQQQREGMMTPSEWVSDKQVLTVGMQSLFFFFFTVFKKTAFIHHFCQRVQNFQTPKSDKLFLLKSQVPMYLFPSIFQNSFINNICKEESQMSFVRNILDFLVESISSFIGEGRHYPVRTYEILQDLSTGMKV